MGLEGWGGGGARVCLQQRGEMSRRGEDAHARLLVERELREHAARVEAQLELAGRSLDHRAQRLDGAAPHEALACAVARLRGEVAQRAWLE